VCGDFLSESGREREKEREKERERDGCVYSGARICPLLHVHRWNGTLGFDGVVGEEARTTTKKKKKMTKKKYK